MFTAVFKQYVRSKGFKLYFCRKSDPESKGKVENVVKYIKRNFLYNRTFHNEETLNDEAIAWLARTANAMPHCLIRKNLKYPAGRTDYVGVVYVAFTVREDGSTTDFKVVKGLCDICDTNAIKTLMKMPKWTPAPMDDKPTRRSIVVAVEYEL